MEDLPTTFDSIINIQSLLSKLERYSVRVGNYENDLIDVIPIGMQCNMPNLLQQTVMVIERVISVQSREPISYWPTVRRMFNVHSLCKVTDVSVQSTETSDNGFCLMSLKSCRKQSNLKRDMYSTEDVWKTMGILFDEIKIKFDLVYDKHTGELIGYCNLDKVINIHVFIVDIIEPEVRIKNKNVPSDNEEDDTAERLQRVLQQKLDENKKEAELLRMQTFEKNQKKRQRLEKQLLSNIEKNRMGAEKELRLCRHKQEQEEMLRESSGEMDEILSGRGGPLKKTSYGLLGNPQGLQGSNRNNTSDVSTYF
ncbi:unnamed protein product [Mytilus coruscus]|uniref:Uncharacterized protein n=1 Tax=Mytilus coruscus TaxID=42192 RepID=A0A6J8DT55_MYTCO|nr:unnamed protein product [Mytilus coruscus]